MNTLTCGRVAPPRVVPRFVAFLLGALPLLCVLGMIREAEDNMSDDPTGMVHACKARRISIPSFVPSFAEYVCASLELPPEMPVARAVWRAANTYLWMRVSEDKIKAGIADDFRAVLGDAAVDDVLVVNFLRELRQRRLEYFSRQWAQLDAVVAVCSSDYRAWRRAHSEQQRQQLQRSDNEEMRLPVITLAQWKSTVVHESHSAPVVLVLYAPFSSLCREVLPVLHHVADSAALLMCLMDGSADEAVVREMGVTHYPCLDLYRGGTRVDRFVVRNPRDADTMSAWLSTHIGKTVMAAKSWRSVFSSDQMQQLRESMREERRRSTVKETLLALGCVDRPVCHSFVNRTDAPTVILMGGGIATGKSTVAAALRNMEWWRTHGENVVVVEADRYKASDPLMDHMVKRGAPHAFAAHEVHRESTSAAEELFLQALTERRDIVFDGTMKWNEFVRQTVAMIRDCHKYQYRRGPGFVAAGNEQYWVRGDAVSNPGLPYQVWLVAAYCNPIVSVGRSIRRAVLDDRGVSLREVLLSHKWFAQNFPAYIGMVDDVILYDNSKSRPLDPDAVAYLPVVAEKRSGAPFRVLDGASYAAFLRCSELDPDARCAAALFADDAPCALSDGVDDLEEVLRCAQVIVVLRLTFERARQHAAPANDIVMARLRSVAQPKL